MKKRIFAMAGALALVAAVGLGSTLAYFTDSETAKNTAKMGKVDITLFENGEVTTGLTFDDLVPGEMKHKHVEIKNNEGNPCYVRVSVASEWKGDVKVDLPICIAGWDNNGRTSGEMTDISDLYWNDEAKVGTVGWIKSGDYWYLCEKTGPAQGDVQLKILKKNEVVTLFNDVTIPAEWNNAVAEKSFTIDIKAEAIQAEHLNPNFETKGTDLSFWDVEIEHLDQPVLTTVENATPN